MRINTRIQTAEFEQSDEYAALAQGDSAGAIVTFVGRVRAFAGGAPLWLEHYPGMTDAVLEALAQTALTRFDLHAVRLVHRVGELAPGAPIVFVGTSARHRSAAFAGTEFLIDRLKTEAPFWKREGEHWVEAKETDAAAGARWQ